jgi:filamentous hemagglutinin family protein
MKLSFPWCSLTASWIIGVGLISPTVAEIVPDATLSRPSRVTHAQGQAVITEGTQRGDNLFHSFREFSVTPREAASFQAINPAVRNIFARVTGGNPSRINGLLEVSQSSANLFLINPNGIIFGQNASLQIGGSFLATTAERLNFADGTQFSAIKPQTAPLLTTSVPIGLQFGDRPGPIVNRSTAPQVRDAAGNVAFDDDGLPIAGLTGSPGRTFALVGGNVTLTDGSSIRTNGGPIEIGSVAGPGQVTLVPTSQGWDLGYAEIDRFGDIQLLNALQLNASGAVGGAIQLWGRRVILRNSQALSISTDSTFSQPGGVFSIAAADLVAVERYSLLTTQTDESSFGRAGDIILSTQHLAIRSGSSISSITYGYGRGGNIDVNASQSVIVAGIFPGNSLFSFLSANSEGPGTAGNLRLKTDRLQIPESGQISASTFDSGDAGDLTIRANTIELTGTALNANGQPIFRRGIPVSNGLFVGTAISSSGDGGSLKIDAERLVLRDGAILQATTQGSGRAGNIAIQADSVEVSGTSEQGGFPARIAATSGGIEQFSTAESRRATGRGGDLDISTERLLVSDGGLITVNSLNPDAVGAGTVRIEADQIALNQGQINAQTESGNRARIGLEGVELLTLRRNSAISTRAGENNRGGDAGNVNIAADLIVAAPTENSDIDADAVRGQGGDITIGAEGILGITERQQRTPLQSDITASSESNVDGEININTTTVNPAEAIAELPSTVVDASQLIAQGCRVGREADGLGNFVVSGRGGLPPNPADLRGSDAVVTDWVTLPPASAAHMEASVESTSPAPVVEAQGWVRNRSGEVMLVAQAPVETQTAHSDLSFLQQNIRQNTPCGY